MHHRSQYCIAGACLESKNKITLVREQRESAAAASVAQRAIRQQEKEDAERAANGAPTRSHTSGAQKRAHSEPIL